MNQLGAPLALDFASRELGSRQAQTGEANMVIGPVAASAVGVRGAFALVKLRADQYVDHQTVFHVHTTDLARRQRCMPAQLADDMDRITAVDDLRITWNQYANVMQVAHGSRQCGRHIAQPTGFHQIGQFGGHEQHFASVDLGHGRLRLNSRRWHLQHRNALVREHRQMSQLADRLVKTLSLLGFHSGANHQFFPLKQSWCIT